MNAFPQELTRLIDEISLRVPQPFLEAILPGADLSRVWPQFALWLLTDSGNGIAGNQPEEIGQAIQNAVILFADWAETGKSPKASDWNLALEYAQGVPGAERWPATPGLWAAARMLERPLDASRAAADVASIESGREATWQRFGKKLLELLRQVPAAAAA